MSKTQSKSKSKTVKITLSKADGENVDTLSAAGVAGVWAFTMAVLALIPADGTGQGEICTSVANRSGVKYSEAAVKSYVKAGKIAVSVAGAMGKPVAWIQARCAVPTLATYNLSDTELVAGLLKGSRVTYSLPNKSKSEPTQSKSKSKSKSGSDDSGSDDSGSDDSGSDDKRAPHGGALDVTDDTADVVARIETDMARLVTGIIAGSGVVTLAHIKRVATAVDQLRDTFAVHGASSDERTQAAAAAAKAAAARKAAAAKPAAKPAAKRTRKAAKAAA